MKTQTYTQHKEMLSEREAADYIGMSAAYLKKKRYEGALENKPNGPNYFKIGKCIRYAYEDLNAWLKGRKIILQNY